jgi:V/A-type H+-transporting ATPase subunit I
MDDTREAGLLAEAKQLSALEEKLRSLDTAAAKEQLTVEALNPWRGGPPLDYSGTKHVAAEFGTVAASTNMDAFSAALTEAAEASEIIEISADQVARYLVVFYLRAEDGAVQPVLRSFGFTPPAFGTATGPAADCIAAAEERIRAIGTQRIETEARIAAQAKFREEFRICYDRAEAEAFCAEETDKLLLTERSVLLDGWAVADREAEVTKALDDMDCAYEFADPVEEEYPEVPVRLKNNRLTDGLNMVTNMYSLPQYGTVDPNPLMAPFFILFYGIMMADMGYGLLMILIGALFLKKTRPKGGSKHLFGLMVLCGVSTFIFGALTGAFLGDFLTQVVKLTSGKDFALPALFTPLNDTLMILVGSMALGFVHIVTGMAVSVVEKFRGGKYLDALFNEITWWVIFAGLALLVLKVTPVVLYVGLALVVIGPLITGKGMGKITGIFSSLYSNVTGFFGDILSYSRLMALMLAGSVIAQVFNTLGAIPGNIVIFVIISLVGNALNFALNLLGCYVHDLRLQCLEYFGKFYQDGGKPFRPLEIETKFVDVD